MTVNSPIPVLSIPLTGGVVTGIPQLDQIHEPTLDGAAAENASDDCVFTCNAMLSRFYHPEFNADGDAIKDSIPAYGQGYVGFSSQDTIIQSGVLESKWGIHSWRIDAPNRAALLGQIITLANVGTPSIVTIPSQWGSQPSQPGYDPDHPNFYTHACVFAGTTPDGTCVLVNPWGGFLMYYSQADLALRLCFLCAYPVAKATPAEVNQTMAGIPNGWHDDGATLTAPNGRTVLHGFRDHIIAAPVWPSALVPVDGEYGTPTGTQQDFALSLAWNRAGGAIGEVAGPAFPDQITALRQQIATLTQQVSDLTDQLKIAQGKVDPIAQKCRDTLATLKAALGEL